MGVRIISDADGAVLYCSTSGWAFGPVFEDHEQAEEFCDWFTEGRAIEAAVQSGKVGGIPELDGRRELDPRSWNQSDLEELYGIWLKQRDDREPTDNEIYNRVGVEGGIGYSLTDDSPGSLGENDWRL